MTLSKYLNSSDFNVLMPIGDNNGTYLICLLGGLTELIQKVPNRSWPVLSSGSQIVTAVAILLSEWPFSLPPFSLRVG